MVSFLWILKLAGCPVEVFPVRANNPGRLRENFMYQHWKLKVAIVYEGMEPLPRCEQCGMHTPADRLFKHRRTDKCNKATERRLRQRDMEMAARCGKMNFSLYVEEGENMVEGVEKFKYMG